MALKKLENNQYIKIELDGTFKIYKTQKERTQEKKATSFDYICKKYNLIIRDLRKNTERRYYDPTFNSLIDDWQQEFDTYLRCHSQGLHESKFPLIKQFIKDVEKSLPEIICVGQLGVTGTTLTEVYDYVKQHSYFSDTADC